MKKIKIKNLNHFYKHKSGEKYHVLKDINLDIEKSDFIVILGESGCGKTTFLNIIAGLLIPSNGSLIIDGKKIKSPHYTRSMIFQNPTLLPWLNIKENILFGCRLRKDIDNINERISKYIDLMGLKGFEKEFPKNLSSGMAQRVSFARSMINKPDILLLDEPFTALDFYNRSRLQAELIRNWLFEKYTIIFVTHNIDEAILLGRHIVLLGNTPTNIVKIYEVDLKYPRNLNNKELYDLRIKIQNQFEKLAPLKNNNNGKNL